MTKTREIPPNVLNRLQRSREPQIAVLQGPGLFRLPTLARAESLGETSPDRNLIVHLDTEAGQGVQIVLTQRAAASLYGFLDGYFSRQKEIAAKSRKT